MPAITVGSVEVDVVPSAQGIDARLRAALIPPASRIGDEVGRIIGRQIAAQMAPAIRDGINNGARAARPAAARQGDETAGAFSRSLKARLEAAFRSLPKADVSLSTTGFDADMARLRARLETLSGKRIGIDVDAGAALAEIADIEARLKRLGAEHPNVQVRADTAAALAQLAALRAEVDAVDGKNVDVDASSATASINGLVFAALALGPALIPVLPVIAAGLGAVAAAGAAAAAGVGSLALVAVPAFKQIGTVLQAQKAAQDAATNASLRGGQANSQGASKALQMAGAQQALATAERNGARQIAQAQAQVKQAKQGVADAIAQAAERTKQAEQQVVQAEKDLAQAQKDEKQAQLDLTAARKEAARQLEDMNNQLVDSQLSLRDAQLRVKEAQQNLNSINAAGSKATALQRAQAQLAYDEAVQHLKEQQTQTKRAQADTAAANKAGVNGSKTVKDAQDQLAQSQQNVTDRTQALKNAQANQAKVAQDNAKQIAAAQQRVADAQKNVAYAQQNAADSVASAQRQIASASQQAAGGVDQAAIAQSKYQQALAKLTPSARDTLNAFLDLRSAFSAWARSLQPAVMPIFTRALVSLRNTLPTLTPFVLGAAGAIKTLQDRASASVKKPFWQGFKQDLQTNVRPAIIGLGIAFGNVIKGMAGVIDAFLPHMNSISSTMQRITGRFANWGASLKGSPEFERFLAYAAEHGPVVARVLGQIFTAFLDVAKALSPIGDVILPLLGGTAEAIGIIADKAPWFIQLVYGIILATKVWSIVQSALNAAMSANPWVLLGLAIIALVGFVIYAYNKWGWFRDLVLTVWSAIKTAALFAWNNILKPVFNALVLAVQTVGRWAMWLWNNAIKPAWDAISLAARILLTAIVVIAILPIIAVIKILGAIGMWLWTHAIKPAFQGIAAIARWLWTNVFNPVFQQIGDKARWLYNNAIKPTWNAIVSVSRWLWNTILKPLLKAFWQGLQTLGGWAKWLYKNAIKPAWDAIVAVGKGAWKYGIKPIFDKFKDIVHDLKSAFDTAVGGIKKAWDKIKQVSKAPVQYVVDVVYNNGIRGVWNKVASAFGAPRLKAFKFASGGIMPGYTPGRDVHRFISPTGGALELSGGEAIMRPEFTRAVGSGFVSTMNSIAKSGGAQGVKAALAPVFGGSAPVSTDRSLRYSGGGVVQSFADGGIFGWIGKAANKVAGAGSDVWNTIKKSASWLSDTLEASARAGVKHVVDPLLKSFPGMDSGFGQMIRRIPNRILDALFGYAKNADKKGAGGLGGPRIAAALKWAKTQAGKPYQWAGNGNPSWDCCIVGPVRVYGPNGATPIQEVHAGDEVYSYVDGKLTVQTVTAAWQSKTQPVFKVRTRNRAVTASANHPFMRLVQTAKSEHVKGGKRGEQIPAKYGIEWARLDELKRGDLLVQPREMAPQEVAAPELPDGTPVTADIAWLLGLFVGDGYMNRNTVRICVYDDLSVRAQMVFRNLGVNSFTAQKHGVVASSVQLVKDLTAMGFHKPGAEKRVPDAVWTWSQELRQAFLDGYCDADGHRPKDRVKHGDRTYSSASRELIEDVRAMHIMLGHPASNISTNHRTKPITIKGKTVKKALPLHTFTVWAGEGRGEVALRRLPGVAAWLDAGDFTLTKVLEVSDEGVQETYDLEVEGAHNFIADGVVVHNSGFMSAIESVIRGQKPHRRWATMAFSGRTAPPGWVYHGNSAFKVGITNAGVGHTAGTLGKTNVESRGGDGVVVGSRARGYNNKLFGSWYGFMPGKYDSGGFLQPGLNLAYNGTGRPEPVFTSAQAGALLSLAARGGDGAQQPVVVELHAKEGELGQFIDVRIQDSQQQLVQVINAT